MSQGKQGTRFIGVEMDSISGRIAKALHPDQDIRIESFRDTKLPEDRIDAVIGNVPFADLKLDYHGQKLSLHDYFFAKSVDALKPGGVLALVTIAFHARQAECRHPRVPRPRKPISWEPSACHRMPSSGKAPPWSPTSCFFASVHRASRPDHVDPDWLGIAPLAIDGVEVPVNRYFLNHPEMVLGTWTRKDTLYGGEGYSVIGNGDLAEQLKEAIDRLPEFAPIASIARPGTHPPRPSRRRRRNATSAKAVSSSATTEVIYQIEGGQGVPVVYGGTTLKADGTLTGKRLAALVGLRDRARRVLQSQNEGWPEANRNEARRELNRAYDRFVATYGPINKTTFGETADGSVIRRMPNLVKFREDPDAMLVMSLEDYDEVTGKATKAAIMTKDVVGKTPPITHVRSAEEGLLVSLNQRGAVDLPFIAHPLRQARSSRSSPSWAT